MIDIAQAHDWYKAPQPGRANQFLLAVAQVFERLEHSADRFAN
jgi:hypothetical protein